MAGLSLGVGGYGGAGYIPAAVPVASNSASSNISQAAFGISSGGMGGPRTAGLGTVGVAIGATAVLVWLWYTLPR